MASTPDQRPAGPWGAQETPAPAEVVGLDSAVATLLRGRVDAVLAALVDGIDRLPQDQLAPLAAGLLRVRAAAEGAVFALTAQADTRGVIAASSAANISQWLRTRAHEGGAALTAAAGTGYSRVVQATRTPGMAVLKEATITGRIPVAGADLVAREFTTLRSRVDPGVHDGALEALIQCCAHGVSGRGLGEVSDAVLSQYGLAHEFEEDCARRAARATFTGFRRTRDGMYAARIELDPASHAVAEPALSALSEPAPTAEGFSDLRSPGKRRADALVEMCSVVACEPELLSRSQHPTHDTQLGAHARAGRAARAQLVVTMPYTWLIEQIGHGTTSFDQPIPPSQARTLACDAGIIPLVLGTDSQPLDVGRASRLATPAQRHALTIRDRGCTFPGCQRPPSWCQAHHLLDWHHGGPTDLNNLAMLCTRHHTIVHRDHYTATIEQTPNGPQIRWRAPTPTTAHRQQAA